MSRNIEMTVGPEDDVMRITEQASESGSGDISSGVAVEMLDALAIPAWNVEVAIRSKRQLRRTVKWLGGKVVEVFAGGATISFDVRGVMAADVEVAVWSKRQTPRSFQTTTRRQDELANHIPRRPVVTHDVVGILAGHVQIGVGPEDHGVRATQSAPGCENAQELAGNAVETQNLIARVTAH